MNMRVPRLFDFRNKAASARAGNFAPAREKHQAAESHAKSSGATAQPSHASAAGHSGKPERRHRRRVKISAPVRVRQMRTEHAMEFDFTMTLDVSREGVLLETARNTYARGQEVAVVFPYRPAPGETVREQRGQVVRVARASEKRFSIAVAFLEGAPADELVDSLGRPITTGASAPRTAAPPHERPLVIVVDNDVQTRLLLRARLEREGYAVEAFSHPAEAAIALRHRMPIALICEGEPFAGRQPGTEMSGYDLCVVVRRNGKLARLPVILTTRTGMPSDFATAHALGATVCVAKPYNLERMANLMHMLAPAGATEYEKGRP